MVNVAILGFGVVGSGVAEVLATNGSHIDKKVDDLIRLKYILDVRDFPDSPFADQVIHDFSIIENDHIAGIVCFRACRLFGAGRYECCRHHADFGRFQIFQRRTY